LPLLATILTAHRGDVGSDSGLPSVSAADWEIFEPRRGEAPMFNLSKLDPLETAILGFGILAIAALAFVVV